MRAAKGATSSIVGRNRQLGLVGLKRTSIGTKTPLVAHHTQPCRITAARLGWIENVNIGPAVTSIMLAAPSGLGTGHDPLALVVLTQVNHHVGDGRLALGLVGIFPEKEITRLEIPAQKIAIGEAVGSLGTSHALFCRWR